MGVPLLEIHYQLCYAAVESQDAQHKPDLVTFYTNALSYTEMWLHRLGSKRTITKGLEMFIILIQLLLNVARHNASRFFIIFLL